MRRILIIVGALLLSLVALILWMAGGEVRLGPTPVLPRKLDVPARPRVATSTLTVVTWNIAWGYGWGSELRQDAAKKTPEELGRALDAMAATLRGLDADLVLLQEVDFGAARSGGVDQAALLATKAGLPWVAPLVSWDLRYLPYPYWPPAKHAGRMRSGGAILSRFPLASCFGEALEKPASQPLWYRPFYLFRYFQGCTADVEGRAVDVVNAHLEAFDPENRAAQAKRLADVLRKSRRPELIFGGDLNAVPPEANLRHAYPDEPETDHRGDPSIATLRGIEGLAPAISPEALKAAPERYLTFPSHAPNRLLDHLFVGRGLRVLEARVVTEAGTSSDHLPVVMRVAFERSEGEKSLSDERARVPEAL